MKFLCHHHTLLLTIGSKIIFFQSYCISLRNNFYAVRFFFNPLNATVELIIRYYSTHHPNYFLKRLTT